MNLGSEPFETILRQCVRRTPIQKARRKRRCFGQLLADWDAVWSWMIWVVMFASNVGRIEVPMEKWRLLANLTALMIIERALRMQKTLSSGSSLPAFEVLPIENEKVFRWHWSRERWGVIVASCAIFVCYRQLDLINITSVVGWILMAGIAILHAAFLSSLTAGFLWLNLGRTFSFVLAALLIAVFWAGWLPKDSASPQLEHFRRLDVIANYLPTIWPCWGLSAFFLGGKFIDAWFLAPTVVIAAALPWIENVLAANYRLPMVVAKTNGASEETLERRRRWKPFAATNHSADRSDEKDVDARIRRLLRRELDRGPVDWKRKNLLGQVMLHWLTQQDRAILDYLLYFKAFITPIRGVVKFLLSILAIGTMLAVWQQRPEYFALPMILSMAFLGLRHLEIPGLDRSDDHRQIVPVHAYLPVITFRSFSATYFKLLIAEWLMFAPLLFLATALAVLATGLWEASWKLLGGGRSALIFTTTIVSAGVLATPALLTCLYWPMSNRLLHFVWIAALGISLGLSVVWIQQPILHIAALLFSAFISLSVWRWYDRANRTDHLDIVISSPPPMDGSTGTST